MDHAMHKDRPGLVPPGSGGRLPTLHRRRSARRSARLRGPTWDRRMSGNVWRHSMKTIAALLVIVLASLGAASAAIAAGVPQSGDIAKRGFTKADFPRWKELAPNVYAYE